MNYPEIVIMRDADDNYLIGKFQKEFKATPESKPVPEYKIEQFWGYYEEPAVKRELA